MRRKINLVGTSTLTISLPAKTAKKFKLKKGDEVEIKEQGNTIVIELGKLKRDEVGRIYFKRSEEFLKRYLINLYNQGYDAIEITSDEPLNFREIKRALAELLGFEIVDQTEKSCVIKRIASPEEDEFNAVLLRIFHVVHLMAQNGLEALIKRNHNLLRETIDLDVLASKFINFCIRVLYQQKPVNSLYLYYILSEVEQISDDWKRICQVALISKEIKCSSQTAKFYESIIEHFRKVFNAFYKFKREEMSLLKQSRLNLFNDGESLLAKTKGQESLFIHYLLEVLNRIHHIETNISYCVSSAEL
ncbi:MAG: AbrB/MazE/SpoVT family DNA-binding domain-containing protein [Candidatus Woesearchaeota archaeon]